VNDAWVMYVVLAAVVLLACGLLAAAWSRGRLGLASAVLLAVAVAAWMLDLAAVTSGFQDADGFVDCGSACRPVHRAAAVGFLAPPLLISLAASGLVVALIARQRKRRGR